MATKVVQWNGWVDINARGRIVCTLLADLIRYDFHQVFFTRKSSLEVCGSLPEVFAVAEVHTDDAG